MRKSRCKSFGMRIEFPTIRQLSPKIMKRSYFMVIDWYLVNVASTTNGN
jgi:hypothetical protein